MPQKARVHGQAEAQQRKAQRASLYDQSRGSASSRGYGRDWQPIREAVLLRDQGVCKLCGALVGKSGHVDHIISKAQGGGDDMANLRTLCASCHASKTALTDHGFGR